MSKGDQDALLVRGKVWLSGVRTTPKSIGHRKVGTTKNLGKKEGKILMHKEENTETQKQTQKHGEGELNGLFSVMLVDSNSLRCLTVKKCAKNAEGVLSRDLLLQTQEVLTTLFQEAGAESTQYQTCGFVAGNAMGENPTNDAKHIVHCVNTHAKLEADVKMLTGELEEIYRWFGLSKEFDSYERLKKVIKQVGENK